MIRNRNGSCATFLDFLHHYMTFFHHYMTTASPHLDEIMRRQDSANFATRKDAQPSQRRPRRESHRLHYASAFRLPPPALSRRTESMPFQDYHALRLRYFPEWRRQLPGTGPRNRSLRVYNCCQLSVHAALPFLKTTHFPPVRSGCSRCPDQMFFNRTETASLREKTRRDSRVRSLRHPPTRWNRFRSR